MIEVETRARIAKWNSAILCGVCSVCMCAVCCVLCVDRRVDEDEGRLLMHGPRKFCIVGHQWRWRFPGTRWHEVRSFVNPHRARRNVMGNLI